jgi:hypothetical protein
VQLLSWFAKYLRMNLNSQRQEAARKEVDTLRREEALLLEMVHREQQVGRRGRGVGGCAGAGTGPGPGAGAGTY